MSIIPFKDRTAQHGQRVKVYLNLHRSEGRPGAIDKPWYSVVDVRTGKVVAHADQLTLTNAVFHIDPAGRDKVRATGRKNVHAWIVGDIDLTGMAGSGEAQTVFYDPYRVDHFVVAGTTVRVENADRVQLAGHGVSAWPATAEMAQAA